MLKQKRGLRPILLIALVVATTSTAAHALSIDPRCAKMRDPLGCTCAVQNGGGIKVDRGTGGTRWYSKRATNAAPNEDFVQCQIKAGRK
jgi:hypothetical protein